MCIVIELWIIPSIQNACSKVWSCDYPLFSMSLPFLWFSTLGNSYRVCLRTYILYVEAFMGCHALYALTSFSFQLFFYFYFIFFGISITLVQTLVILWRQSCQLLDHFKCNIIYGPCIKCNCCIMERSKSLDAWIRIITILTLTGKTIPCRDK